MTKKKPVTNNEKPVVRRSRVNGRETVQKILYFAQQELESSGLVNFNLDRVIEASGVSRSSVYHHFGGREGVIAAVELDYLRTLIAEGMTEITAILNGAATGEEAFSLVEIGILISGSDDQKAIRRQRILNLAMAANSPETMEMLREFQDVVASQGATFIRELQDRGFCDPVEPIEGTVHLIQSMLLGRILVDILGDSGAEAQWTQSAVATLRFLLRPKG
jgi:AcrR family transcriptional regulator